ncbi:ATP-binding cassette domain-containing protein [Silvanigrella paludirubra]|jgi:putative ABC transport system ATP-binding protein|uniref:ATP-binding cassette domain-containing protein n=1 Tax=Silvanigrella paludirubra TaxID=2499159 RepID=A0A6N6W038_9BACT|nr:ATP-binding cassette domain-containing protein [Silvanigrella paludirubra]KAB8040992.1 ATP-binding cassette domain-containing protein [Silvanigrella paludirubra]
MIKIENVHVSFGEFKALQQINCAINEKDFILILGHNGAGKSTLLDTVSGRIIPTQGKIFRNNTDITTLSEAKRSQFISRVFQNTHMGSVATMTVAENLAMATLKGKIAGFKSAIKNFPEYIVEETLKPLNLRLEEHLNTPIGKLSGGQRQIITIVMATLCDPDILLLDEPTAALDPVSTENLLQFVHNFTKQRKMATMMITHDEQRAKFLANRTWVLQKGFLQTE